jgi:hypothetical protein
LGAILISSSPRRCFLFSLMSRNYLTSGLFSWCDLFLIAYSSIFSSCSNPGLARLSCTVKTKLSQQKYLLYFNIQRL